MDEVHSREDFTLRPPRAGPLPVRLRSEIRATAADWLDRTGADYIALRLRHPTGPSHEDTLGAIARFSAPRSSPKANLRVRAP